ncbi:hypothetical protein BH11ARM2_BH11ARM2_18350 [soil metagenome]
MTFRFRHLALVALSTVASSALAAQTTYSTTDLEVRMVPGTNAKLVDAGIGATEIKSLPQIGWRIVRVSSNVGTKKALKYYLASKAVLDAQIPAKAETFATPNDPSFRQQYSLTNMSVPGAWDLSIGSAGVVIAIIDTGLDLKHPEFPADKVVQGYDFSSDDTDVTPEDPKKDGHGTHVAGISAAATNNSIGIAGVGYNCKVMPLKVFPNSYFSNIARAVLFAADNGAKVINMSLGAETSADKALGDAITYAVGKGLTVVCAAGNSAANNDVREFYPTNYPNVISVGASDRFDRKADFSNYGQKVLVAAPGVDVYSTLPTGDTSYGVESGTSMASPNTAGVVGLMYAYSAANNFQVTPALIRQALLKSTDNIGTGFVATGRVNALRALTFLRPAKPVDLGYVDSAVYGSTLGPVPASLQAKDGVYLNLPMTYESGLGQTAMYVIDFNVPAAVDFSQFVDSTLKIAGKMHTNGVPVPQSSIQIYLWNYQLSRYQVVSQVTMAKDLTFKLPINQSPYRSPLGKVQVLLRGLIPVRTGNPKSGSTLALDYVASDVTYRSFGN